MSCTPRILSIVLLLVLAPAGVRAEQYFPTEGTGNVQQGCDGVQDCLMIFHSGGSATNDDYDLDARIFTNHLPSTWGMVNFVPSGIPGGSYYSSADTSSDGAKVGALAQQFSNGNLHGIGMSDGVRALRRMQNDGHLPAQMGLMIELDGYSPSFLQVQPPVTSINYAAYASFYGDYIFDGERLAQTGPAFGSSQGLSFDFIAIRRGTADNFFEFLDVHAEILGDDRQRVQEILTGYALGGSAEAIQRLNENRRSEVAPPLTDDGDPIVTAPPTSGGGGESPPFGGGGVGVESKPDWRHRRSGATP